MKRIVRVGATVLGTLAVLLVLAWIVFVVVVNLPLDDTSLAKNLTVTNDWTEINIDPPLTPGKRTQNINVRVRAYQSDGAVRLPDGTNITPEIELFDESGASYEFYNSGWVTKFYNDMVFSVVGRPGITALPVDRRYTRLRIRSSIPFECDQIYWRDSDPK